MEKINHGHIKIKFILSEVHNNVYLDYHCLIL